MSNKNNLHIKFHVIFTLSISVLMTGTLVGCATNESRLNAKNFRERIKIEKEDVTLYSGKYIGNETDCFPPIGNRICKLKTEGQPLYEKEVKLEMEILTFSIIFGTSGNNGDVSDELMYLTAAELGMQRGYKMFTPLDFVTSLSCSENDVTNVRGQISNGAYSAWSTTSKSTICAGSVMRKILFFNDKNALGKGVLQQQHSGVVASEYAWPLIALYFGSIPGLNLPKDIAFPSYNYSRNWPYEGWKYHYVAETVAKEMRQKHSVNDQPVFKVNIKMEEGSTMDKLRQQ